MLLMVARPRTYRLDPGGGFDVVPIDTPFAYVTFAALLVH